MTAGGTATGTTGIGRPNGTGAAPGGTAAVSSQPGAAAAGTPGGAATALGPNAPAAPGTGTTGRTDGTNGAGVRPTGLYDSSPAGAGASVAGPGGTMAGTPTATGAPGADTTAAEVAATAVAGTSVAGTPNATTDAPATTTTKAPGTATIGAPDGAPDGTATGTPDGTATDAPNSGVTGAPNGAMTSTPGGGGTAAPNGSVTGASDGAVTNTPGSGGTDAPNGVVTGAPDDSSTSAPGGGGTGAPGGGVTGAPNSGAAGSPADTGAVRSIGTGGTEQANTADPAGPAGQPAAVAGERLAGGEPQRAGAGGDTGSGGTQAAGPGVTGAAATDGGQGSDAQNNTAQNNTAQNNTAQNSGTQNSSAQSNTAQDNSAQGSGYPAGGVVQVGTHGVSGQNGPTGDEQTAAPVAGPRGESVAAWSGPAVPEPAQDKAAATGGRQETTDVAQPGRPAADAAVGAALAGDRVGVAPGQQVTAAGGAGAQQVPLPQAAIAGQVAMVLTPLRKGPDGVHRMTIHLNPEELGAVSIVAEVRGGAITVQLQAGSDAGRAALQAALPELRQDLQQAGFGGCELDLHQQSSPNGNPPQQFSGWHPGGRSDQRAPERRAETPDRGTQPVTEDATGALDLRV
ncbi:flagellar hook-length control protein FliK [Dactylosporangium fulvum]